MNLALSLRNVPNIFKHHNVTNIMSSHNVMCRTHCRNVTNVALHCNEMNICQRRNVMNITHFDMWHSCSYLIMLQNSFLCDNATNFLASQWYAHRLVITIWWTIAPQCDIHGYSNVRMWQTFPNIIRHIITTSFPTSQ